MKLMTKIDFDKLREQDTYWHGRWPYLKEVIDILKNEQFNSCLELGAKESSIVKGSDKMDIVEYEGLKYLHDAKKVPWPIENKQYDVVIALQVFEHLRDKQKEAFIEIIRCSKMAILSFPYKWNVPDDPMHHNIDEETIKTWTLRVEPVKIIPVISLNRSPEKARNRIIYFFKFK